MQTMAASESSLEAYHVPFEMYVSDLQLPRTGAGYELNPCLVNGCQPGDLGCLGFTGIAMASHFNLCKFTGG